MTLYECIMSCICIYYKLRMMFTEFLKYVGLREIVGRWFSNNTCSGLLLCSTLLKPDKTAVFAWSGLSMTCICINSITKSMTQGYVEAWSRVLSLWNWNPAPITSIHKKIFGQNRVKSWYMGVLKGTGQFDNAFCCRESRTSKDTCIYLTDRVLQHILVLWNQETLVFIITCKHAELSYLTQNNCFLCCRVTCVHAV